MRRPQHREVEAQQGRRRARRSLSIIIEDNEYNEDSEDNEEGGPAAEAGLRVGDVIVAVGGKACYSHMHTSRLLGASSNPLELLVWQPSYRPFDSPNSTYYDSGVEVVSVF